MSILTALSVATPSRNLRLRSVSTASASSTDAWRFNRTLSQVRYSGAHRIPHNPATPPIHSHTPRQTDPPSQSGPTLTPTTLGLLVDGADRGRSLSASLAASSRGELAHCRTTSLEAKTRSASETDDAGRPSKALRDVRRRTLSLSLAPSHAPLLSVFSFVAPSLASWVPTGQQSVPAPEPKPETPPPPPAPTQSGFCMEILRDTMVTHELALLQISNGGCTWTIERSCQDAHTLAKAMRGSGTWWSFQLRENSVEKLVPGFRKYLDCLLANKDVHMGWAMWAAELLNTKEVRPYSEITERHTCDRPTYSRILFISLYCMHHPQR